MDATSLKIYSFNISAMTVSSLNILEDSLKILLLLVTIGYTITKWLEIRKKK
jgi:hypothetical protein